MTKQCEHCDSDGANHTLYGVWLCTTCEAAMVELEAERHQEEKLKAEQLAESAKHSWKPSIAYSLLTAKGINPNISLDRVQSYIDKNVAPLVYLLSDEELHIYFELLKSMYFRTKAEFEMRPIERGREAEVIKRQNKATKSRTKTTEENKKQVKKMSTDKRLTPEERAKAKLAMQFAKMGVKLNVEEFLKGT